MAIGFSSKYSGKTGVNAMRAMVKRNFSSEGKKPTKAVKKYVNRTIDRKQELKEWDIQGDTDTTQALTINTWGSDPITAVPQATTQSSDNVRIGDKIRLASCYIATNVMFPALDNLDVTTLLGFNMCRVIVAQMKRGYNVAELIAELPTNSPTSSLKKFDIQRRAYILADRVCKETDRQLAVVSAATAATSTALYGGSHTILKFNVKPKIENLVWDTNTATGSPDIIGAIHILYCSFNVGGQVEQVYTTTLPDSRISFRDA